MRIQTLIASALLAFGLQTAQAAPYLLSLEAQGSSFSTGLSTQVGSDQVTRAQAGSFRDEFLIHFNGSALVNAWLETSADLSLWSHQGISFTRAGFVGVDGSGLTFETFELFGTQFSSGYNLAPFQAQGDFLFFVEGVAGTPDLKQTADQARLNSFSYSGGINVEPLAAELPEPASLALAGLALTGALFSSRRRRADH
jgi:hypothetical protein